jgi:osmotically inducible lipoprotein OsmB
MKNIVVVAALSLALGACATQRQEEGTAAGAVGGALVGGPIGAVVGGAAGAVATAPGAPFGGRRWCRYHDHYGHVHYHRCGI